jgi:hypothetical protein
MNQTKGFGSKARRARGARSAAGAMGLALALTGVGGAVAAQAQAQSKARPYCGITWGSGAKDASGSAPTTTEGVRPGRHTCFDRFVVDGASWARVGYVDRVLEDGSGKLVPLRGGARLQVVTTSGFDGGTGDITYLPPRSKRSELVDVDGYRTFRQVAYAGDFEGQLTLGVGVRARLPYRVFVLPASKGAPSRVVVDVAHRW